MAGEGLHDLQIRVGLKPGVKHLWGVRLDRLHDLQIRVGLKLGGHGGQDGGGGLHDLQIRVGLKPLQHFRA